MNTRRNASCISCVVGGLMTLGLTTSGCKPGDVPYTEGETDAAVISGTEGDTDGVADETANDGGVAPPECLLAGGDDFAPRLQWHCGGRADIKLFVDFDIPNINPASDQLNRLPYYLGGKTFFFSSERGEGTGAPPVLACCDEYPGGGVGAVEAEYDAYPVYAEACAHDCAQQGRRAAVRELENLRDMAAKQGSIQARNQLQHLVNWVKGPPGADAWGKAFDEPQPYVLSGFDVWSKGTVTVPNSDDWPWLRDIELNAECRIDEVSLPPEEDRLSCTSYQDNDDVPWGAGLEDPDDFVTVGGGMDLDGPVLFGVDADGFAPVAGRRDGCAGAACSSLSIDVVDDERRLSVSSLVVNAPRKLVFSEAGHELQLENLKLQLSSAFEVPLIDDGADHRFELPAGALRAVLSGKIHGVQLAVPVTNTFAIEGGLRGSLEGAYEVSLEPLEIEYVDEAGEQWNLLISFDAWTASGYAPQAAASVSATPEGMMTLDASTSRDADGDVTQYIWYMDGEEIGRGAVLHGSWPLGRTVVLAVEDKDGRQGFDVLYL